MAGGADRLTTNLPQDFADLLACLDEADAEYMVVGGYAVMAHGHVRATQDLDVWVRGTTENVEKVMRAMEAFGLPPGLTAEDLLPSGRPPPTGFRFGRPPIAVDLLSSIQGVQFEDAWAGSIVRKLGDLELRVIGRAELLANKRATGRPKDAADVAALEVDEDRQDG